MNNQRKCPKCGAINDGFFEYCYKCGTPLTNRNAYSQPYNPYAGNRYYEPATVAGHPTEEVKAFVGQNDNSRKLMQKLIDTELTGGRTHWCWPVFLFSLFSPMFAAIWFFYRKMYKTGALVGLMGLLLTGADVLLHLDYNVAVIKEMLEIMGASESLYDLIARLEQDVTTLPNQSSVGVLLSSIIDLLSLAGGVIISMYAIGIYKNHINKTLSSNPGIKANYFTLAATGGTSVAAAAISGGALWIIFNVLDNLPLIISIATL